MSLFPPPDDNTISYSTMPPENVEEEVVEVFLSEEVKQKILDIASNGNLNQFKVRALSIILAETKSSKKDQQPV